MKNKGLESISICKNNNSSKKLSKLKNNFSFKMDSLTKNKKNTNSNKTNIINNKSKNVMNTYKTFSEISTKQNDTKKINTSINTINTFNNYNHYLLIEEEFEIVRANKNNNKNIYKEKGIFNGDKLYFDENGLKYGLRGKKDGYGFFGTDTHYHGKIINDYVLNINGIKKQNSNLSYISNSFNDDKNKSIPILYFAIYYEKECNKFYIKNLRKINYNNLESFIFSFGIYQRYEGYKLKIKENMIICFNENQNYALSLQPINSDILRVYLIKIDEFDIDNKSIIYKSNIENNGVSKIIGKKGNIKVDLQGKNYVLRFNKNENFWELKSNSSKKQKFWVMIDKKVELDKENIFKINSMFFKIIYK